MRDTSGRGDLTEAEVTAALLRAGRRVLRPLSSASRYDLVVENEDGTFSRVQCKTGVLKNGAVVFRVYSVSGHRTAGVPYGGQVDAFGVFCAQTNAAYLVPITAVARHRVMASLRVAPPRNGQKFAIRNAEDFRIGR